MVETLFGISDDDLNEKTVKNKLNESGISYECFHQGMFSAPVFIGENIKEKYVKEVVYDFSDIPYDMHTGSVRYSVRIYLNSNITRKDLLYDLNVALGKYYSETDIRKYAGNYFKTYKWIINNNDKSKIINVVLYDSLDYEKDPIRLSFEWSKQ
ncbi:MAG: hypothetical protein LBL50_03735 [Candidatus Margulisbacteria bacterium]|jgi:hypothetical protein|nr:hypothetical protein [Candidatus Margulisiibacteriota bacterium]